MGDFKFSESVCVAARQPRKIDFKRHKPDSRETESWKMKIKILDPGKLSPTVKLRKNFLQISPQIILRIWKQQFERKTK